MSDFVQVPREATEEIIALIDAEMAGVERGYADRRGELLFDIRDTLAAAPQATDPRDAEIEKLKARCEAAERVLDLIDNQRYAAQAEIERLRAALTKIASRCDGRTTYPYRRGPQWAAEIARAAISPPEKE